MARAAAPSMAQRAWRRAPRARRPRRRFLAQPAATITVMLLAVLATGLCAVGGAVDRDAAVLVAEAPAR
jgi:hypothetical protein